jgi:hypothetical protein
VWAAHSRPGTIPRRARWSNFRGVRKRFGSVLAVNGLSLPLQSMNRLRGEIWDIVNLGDVAMIQIMVGGESGQSFKATRASLAGLCRR